MSIENFIRKHLGLRMKFKDPSFISEYCQGSGLEIGGSSYMTFKINAQNVDIIDHKKEDTQWAKEQKKQCGYVKKVDIIAGGDNIPIVSNSVDFVFSSHSLEHFYDPVSAINEWMRVVKPNGYVVLIIPHKERMFDSDKECTSIEEFENRHINYNKNTKYPDKHYSIWTTESFLNFAEYYNYNVVKVLNQIENYPPLHHSFAIIIQKGNVL